MACYYGTTHPNVINCSSMDWKPLRDFLGSIGRTCTYYLAISDDKLVTLTSLVKTWTQQQKVQCVLCLTEFKPITRVQRRVQTEWNVDPPTSKSIHQWERTLKETVTLVLKLASILKFS
ncbi:uncharacterized protein TNCV_5092571 [Trichonephila clavipes]|nr:uncharacterized protein TNCV_5092571 [Trichonephila clavipes]